MIFYPVISLSLAFYCVQLYTVSNTLLCSAHYCVQQNTPSTLTQRVFCSPFTFQCAVIVSFCACEALQLIKPVHSTKLTTCLSCSSKVTTCQNVYDWCLSQSPKYPQILVINVHLILKNQFNS